MSAALALRPRLRLGLLLALQGAVELRLRGVDPVARGGGAAVVLGVGGWWFEEPVGEARGDG